MGQTSRISMPRSLRPVPRCQRPRRRSGQFHARLGVAELGALAWRLRNNYTFVALKLDWGKARRRECIPSGGESTAAPAVGLEMSEQQLRPLGQVPELPMIIIEAGGFVVRDRVAAFHEVGESAFQPR